MDEPILKVDRLKTELLLGGKPVVIVDQLSFALYAGKTLALVGESGCGKTITALSIMRITPQPPALASSGEVTYKGVNLLEISEREMRKIRGGKIAMIFQDPTSALNPVYTVGTQLAEVAELHLALYGEAADERSMRAIREVGIADVREVMEAYPHQLSGGMRQRVMIAMAFMCEPDILIADEPTTALDVTMQAQVLQLMRELQQKNRMAILLITHDMGVVADIADDVIVMYAGQDVERGSVNDIFDHMAHPYTQGLFASRPSIHKPKTLLHTIKGMVPSPTHYPEGCRFHPRCPHVMDICRHGNVPIFQAGGFGPHPTKCWLYRKEER